MRQNTLQDPFFSLYVAVCSVCTCVYGTSVSLLGATYILGQGLFLHQELTHWLAWLVASPAKISISPSWPWGCRCAQPHLALHVYRCLRIWSRVLVLLHPVPYPLSHLSSPQAWQLFNFFLICTTWNWSGQALKSNIPLQSCSLLT